MSDGALSVCVVGPSTRFLGGISYYTLRLANAFGSRYRTSVICLRELLPRFLYPGSRRVGETFTALTYDADIAVYDGMDYNSPITWARAASLLRRESPDILLVPWWTGAVVHMLLFLAIANKVGPRAFTYIIFHESAPKQEGHSRILSAFTSAALKLLALFVDGALTHSSEEARRVADRTAIPHSSVSVIPFGPYDHYESRNPSEAKRLLGLPDSFLFLFLGLIREYKGVPTLVRAFERLPPEVAENCTLAIVGEPWENGEILAGLIANSNARGRIRYVPEFLPDEEVGLYLSAADAVVLPYTRAAGSAVLHTAMAYGKRVVATRVGGLREALEQYRRGHLVAPGDVTGLRDGLTEAYETGPSKNKATHPASWEDVVDRIILVSSRDLQSSG